MYSGSFFKSFDYFGHQLYFHFGNFTQKKEDKADKEFKTLLKIIRERINQNRKFRLLRNRSKQLTYFDFILNLKECCSLNRV